MRFKNKPSIYIYIYIYRRFSNFLEQYREKYIVAGMFFCLAVAMGSISAYWSSLLNWDDIPFVARCATMLENKGFFASCLDMFLNRDTIVELRTYGLSKSLQFVIFAITGGSAKVYYFLIPFLHILSGALVYDILRKLNFSKGAGCILALLYALFPSAHMIRIFHYVSYLSIPFYIWLVYFDIQISSLRRIRDTGWQPSKRVWIRDIILIGMMVFTGESLLAFIGISMIILAWFCWKQGWKQNARRYGIHFAAEVLFTVFAVVLYLLYARRLDRFPFAPPGLLDGFRTFFESIWIAFSQFFLIPTTEINYKGYPHTNALSLVSPGTLIVLLILFAGIFICIGVVIWREHKEKAQTEQPSKFVAFGALFMLPFLFPVYLFMSIRWNWSLNYHYFLLIFAAILLLLGVFAGGILSKRIFYTIGIALLVIFSGYQCIWYSCMVPQAQLANEECTQLIESTANENTKNVVVFSPFDVMHGWAFNPVATNIRTYTADSPFDYALPTQWYLSFECDYGMYYVGPNSNQIYDNGDGTLSVISPTGETVEMLEADATIFIGCEDLEYYCDAERTPQLRGYSDFESYRNSAAYAGIHVTSMKAGYAKGLTEEMFRDTLLWVNAGVTDMPGGSRFLPDKEYEETAEGVAYGAIPGQSAVFSADGTDDYFMTNRHGVDFSYTFSNLPTEDPLRLFFDISESWKTEPDSRLFSIEVTTDKTRFSLHQIDPYVLSAGESAASDSFVRIGIDLPETDSVTIRFIKDPMMPDDSSALPFINGIGIGHR